MEYAELDVAKCSRAIEELKAELLKAQWMIQNGTINASEAQLLDSLAELVGTSYLLSKRLGFDYSRLDRVLYRKIEDWYTHNRLNLESGWGDLSQLLSYLIPDDE